MKSFPELLETLRQEQQISKKTLAILTGLTPGYISLLTRGERTKPSEETVKALADALKLDTRTRLDFFMAAGYSASPGNDESFPALNQPGVDGQGRATIGVDWDEVPEVGNFYGRQEALGTLESWIVDNRCRMVAVLGIGGIGKTSLAAKSVMQIKDRFDYVFWRTLQHAPSVEHILRDCIQLLSNQRQIELPEDIEDQITLLMKYLQAYRCLLVMDNIESVLQGGQRAGQYRQGYEGYGRLIRRIGVTAHQSCLLLTGREKPKEMAGFEGEASPVRSLLLPGMSQSEVQAILKDRGLSGTNEAWAKLIALYSGNPLALKLVSAPIRDLFGGDIAEFLIEGGTIVGDVYDLLDQQFQRLSEQEQEIIYWLAIEREPVSLNDLREDLAHPVSKVALLNALDSVRRRSMIETSGTARFTLQPVIREYVTDKFVETVSGEIDREVFQVCERHALIKAQSRDYIRNSQVEFILKPVAEGLLSSLGKEKSEKKLGSIISKLQESRSQATGYLAGNILNLLVQLKVDLRDYNFSHLAVWQAYLQGVVLPGVNFAHANLARSVFTETFGSIFSVAVSPRGDLLAAGTIKSEIRVWQMASVEPVVTCEGHTDWVRSVAFSPDGSMIASGSDDQTVRLWEVSSGRCLNILQGHGGRVYTVAFSPDGSTIVSGSEDETVRVWEVATGSCLTILRGHSGKVRAVAFSPDGSTIVSGSEDETVRVWEVATGSCLTILRGHSGKVRAVAFSPDGSTIVSGSRDNTVRLWEVATGKCVHILRGHADGVWTVAFGPDGDMVASGSHDQTVRLWDVRTGQCLRTMQDYGGWVYSLAFSSDGEVLASGSHDQAVRLWEVKTGQCLRTMQGDIDLIWSAAFSPDGEILASGGDDQRVRLWDVKSGQPIGSLTGHTNRVWSVAFSPAGEILASGGDDQKVHLWGIKNGRPIGSLAGHTNRIRSIAFNPDGTILISGSDDQTVRLWDVKSLQFIGSLAGHTNEIRSVAFSPDARTIASASEDQTVRLWDVKTRQCINILQGHSNRIRSVAFSPDGEILASGGDDQTICLWKVDSGRLLETLRGHTDGVWTVAFSPNRNIMASGGHDQTVRLWDVSTGLCLKILRGHSDWVYSVVFSPDGSLIASGGIDGKINLWDVETGQRLKTLRSPRPYEDMNITGVEGLSIAQKAMLKTLGAVEH